MPGVAEEVVWNSASVGSKHDVHVRGKEARERLAQLSFPSRGICGRQLGGSDRLSYATRLPCVVGFAESRRHLGRGGLLQERITPDSFASQLTQPEIGDQEGVGIADLSSQAVVQARTETPVKESGHTGLEQVRHVPSVLLMDDDFDVACACLIDDRAIDLTPQLLLTPASIVDPDLDERDLLCGDLTDRGAALFSRGDPPQHGHPGLFGD